MAEKITFVDSNTFKKTLERGTSENIGVIKSYIPDEVKVPSDDESRKIDFVISTGIVDRDKDTLNPKGFVLKNFKKNPVVLFSHDNRQPPVAKASNIRVEDDKLKATAEFITADIYPFGDMIFRMIKGGFLKATSVGFLPMKFERVSEEDPDFEDRPFGVNFIKQELLEFSIVPVPSNPEALVEAKAAGIDTKELYDWYGNVLDDWEEYKSALMIPKRFVALLRDKIADKKDFFMSSGKQENSVFKLSKKKQDDLLKKNLESIKNEDNDSEDKKDTSKNPDVQIKRVITWAAAHPNGTPVDRNLQATWDAGKEVKNADVSDLMVMSAWRENKPRGDLVKGDFKFPHHRASGGHAVVFRGIVAAAGRLNQANIPEADVSGIKSHLRRHFKSDFDRDAPFDKHPELYEAHRMACESKDEAAEHVLSLFLFKELFFDTEDDLEKGISSIESVDKSLSIKKSGGEHDIVDEIPASEDKDVVGDGFALVKLNADDSIELFCDLGECTQSEAEDVAKHYLAYSEDDKCVVLVLSKEYCADGAEYYRSVCGMKYSAESSEYSEEFDLKSAVMYHDLKLNELSETLKVLVEKVSSIEEKLVEAKEQPAEEEKDSSPDEQVVEFEEDVVETLVETKSSKQEDEVAEMVAELLPSVLKEVCKEEINKAINRIKGIVE